MTTRIRPLVGWNLLHYYKAMSQHSDSYHPPTFYYAMKASPPMQNFLVTQKRKGPLVFPDDELRKRIELKSRHAKDLLQQGMSPIPWWFARRPFDEAVAQIKKLKRQHPDKSEDEVIEMFDQEFDLKLSIRKREQQLLQEEASTKGSGTGTLNSGQGSGSTNEQYINAMDAYYMMQLLHDLKEESVVKKEVLLKDLAKKASDTSVLVSLQASKLSDAPTPSFMKGITTMTGHSPAQLAKFVESLELKDGEVVVKRRTEEHVEEVKETAQQTEQEEASLDTYKYLGLDLEKQIHPTQWRKMEMAKQVHDTVLSMIFIRITFLNGDGVFASTTFMTPMDFLYAYVKAFDIDNQQYFQDSLEVEGDRAKQVDGFTVAELLEKRAKDFRESFIRFVNMEEVKVNVNKTLQNVDLGFSSNPFQGEVEEKDILDTLDIPKVDFEAIIDEFCRNYKVTKERKKLMKKHLPHMERLFFYLYLRLYLRPGYGTEYAPIFTSKNVKNADDNIYQYNLPADFMPSIPEDVRKELEDEESERQKADKVDRVNVGLPKPSTSSSDEAFDKNKILEALFSDDTSNRKDMPPMGKNLSDIFDNLKF